MTTSSAWDLFGEEKVSENETNETMTMERANNSAYFKQFTDSVYGDDGETNVFAFDRARAREELRALIDRLECDMNVGNSPKRAKVSWLALSEMTLESAKRSVYFNVEQKRMADWKNYFWLFSQIYAHALYLIIVLESSADGKFEDDCEDTMFNAKDDPRLPAMLRHWGSPKIKFARVAIDFLNLLIGIDSSADATHLLKIPSFSGKLIRAAEMLFCDSDEEEKEKENNNETIVTEMPSNVGKNKSARDLVKNQMPEEDAKMTTASFHTKYFKNGTPCVIRNYAVEQKWKLLDLCKTTAFLSHDDFGGSRVVPVEFGYPGHKDSSAAGVVRLSDFAKKYLNRSNKCDANLNDSDDECKIAYVSQHCLFHHAPKLQQYITIPPLTFGKVTSEGAVNAWIGTRETRTSLHRDPYSNIFVQVSGFKYVRLYLNDQTENVYAEATMTTSEHTEINAFQRSTIKDVENPDIKKFPKFANATFVDTILAPGDALFLPKGVWHYVRSLTTSVSVNFWY